MLGLIWTLSYFLLCGAYAAVLFSNRVTAGRAYPFKDMPTFVRCVEEGR